MGVLLGKMEGGTTLQEQAPPQCYPKWLLMAYLNLAVCAVLGVGPLGSDLTSARVGTMGDHNTPLPVRSWAGSGTFHLGGNGEGRSGGIQTEEEER